MVVRHIHENARGAILSLRRNIHLIGQQKSPVTKEKIVTVLERLYRLGLGKNNGGAVDKEEWARRDVLLSSVIPSLP